MSDQTIGNGSATGNGHTSAGSGSEGRPFGRTLSRVAPLASMWNRIAGLLRCQRGIRPTGIEPSGPLRA